MRRISIADLSVSQVIGVFWFGYATGTTVTGHWLWGACFYGLSLLAVLWGEGVRLTVKA